MVQRYETLSRRTIRLSPNTYDNITHTILQTVRLVINLLQHKVIKTTLAQFADIQIHGLDIKMTGRMLQVDDIQLLTYPDVSNLTIFQIHYSCSHEDAHW